MCSIPALSRAPQRWSARAGEVTPAHELDGGGTPAFLKSWLWARGSGTQFCLCPWEAGTHGGERASPSVSICTRISIRTRAVGGDGTPAETPWFSEGDEGHAPLHVVHQFPKRGSTPDTSTPGCAPACVLVAGLTLRTSGIVM